MDESKIFYLKTLVDCVTLSCSSNSQSVINIRGGHHSISREVERPHQVMNVNKRVEFGHFFRFNNITANSQHPENKMNGLRSFMMDTNIHTDSGTFSNKY